MRDAISAAGGSQLYPRDNCLVVDPPPQPLTQSGEGAEIASVLHPDPEKLGRPNLATSALFLASRTNYLPQPCLPTSPR